MKGFQRKLKNKTCVDASEAHCAPGTSNPALLAEKTLQKSSLHAGEEEERKSGQEHCCVLGVILAAEPQYTHESLLTLNSSVHAGRSSARSKRSQQIAPFTDLDSSCTSFSWKQKLHDFGKATKTSCEPFNMLTIISIFWNPKRIITDFCPFSWLSLVS